MNAKKKRGTPLNIFLGFSLLNLALFLLLMPFLGQKSFDWVVMENNSHFESADYFLCILYSLGGSRVYQFGVDACYSPLSYLVFSFFSKATSAGDLFKGVDLLKIPYEELINMTPKLLSSNYQLLSFLIYTALGVMLYLYAISLLDLSANQKRLLTVCILFSVPLLFGAVERGNLTMYVAALTLIAAQLRNSQDPFQREVALLFIAIAAGLKFYPAFMGLLYLREKRYKEAGRLIIYGAVCVFVPFAFFGGLNGLKLLLSNLAQLAVQNQYIGRIQFFKGALSFMKIHGRAADLLNMVFLLVLAVLFWLTKSNVRRMTYLAAMMAFYPPNAYRYTLLFFLLPLFAWLRENAEHPDKAAYVEALLFAGMFSVPTLFGILTGFRLGFRSYTLTYVELFIYAAAWAFLGFEGIRDIWELFRNRKEVIK